MDGAVLGLVGFVVALVAFDLAALRFGHDSRSRLPQAPLGVAPPADVAAAQGAGGWRRMRPFAPGGGERRRGRARRPARFAVPSPCREALCALRPDLAATGK